MPWLTLVGVALIGQDPAPLTGPAAAWTGAGLLGGVLAWLMFAHLPAKDKQVADLIRSHNEQMAALATAKDHQIDQQRAEFVLTMNTMMTGFRSEAAAERQACERHFEALSGSMTTAFRTLGDQLATQAREAAAHSERNRQWLDVLKREIEERKAAIARGEKGT